MTVDIGDVAVAGFVVGFLGDLGLNILTQRLKVLDAGLVKYFPQHGTVEALFIAGGLVAFTIYLGVLTLEAFVGRKVDDIDFWWVVAYLFVFGSIVDLFFRYLHIMPSLDGMYRTLSIPVSMAFAGGPIAIAYILAYFWKEVM